jgi:hypothetical protein
MVIAALIAIVLTVIFFSYNKNRNITYQTQKGDSSAVFLILDIQIME